MSEVWWRFTLWLLILILDQFRFLSATFWEGLPYFIYVLWLFVIFVVSYFGFEDRSLALIAPVPGHCILVTLCVVFVISRVKQRMGFYFPLDIQWCCLTLQWHLLVTKHCVCQVKHKILINLCTMMINRWDEGFHGITVGIESFQRLGRFNIPKVSIEFYLQRWNHCNIFWDIGIVNSNISGMIC